MKYFSVGHRLLRQLAAPLFGDRRRFGLTVRHDDLCWRQWEKTYLEFYNTTQKRSIGTVANGAERLSIDPAMRHVVGSRAAWR